MPIEPGKIRSYSVPVANIDDVKPNPIIVLKNELGEMPLKDSNGVSKTRLASTIIDNLLLPNEQFYALCSLLNEGQQHLLNFIMQYSVHCKLAENNNELQIISNIFKWRCWCWEKFLATAITEHLRRVLRYPNQNLDQPSAPVTASAGEVATGVSGITLHSAFHLPVKSGLKSYRYKKPDDETLCALRNKHQYLKVLIKDEISLIGRETVAQF